MHQGDHRQQFSFVLADRQLNVKEAEERFGGKKRPWDNKKWCNTVWEKQKPPRKGDKLHWHVPQRVTAAEARPNSVQPAEPTMAILYCEKDQALLRHLIVLLTPGPGSKVWEPMAGTLSGACASRDTQRRWMGSEMNEPCAVAGAQRYLSTPTGQLMWVNQLTAPVSESEATKAMRDFLKGFAEDGARTTPLLDQELMELLNVAASRGLKLARNNFPPYAEKPAYRTSSIQVRAEALGLEVIEDSGDGHTDRGEGGRGFRRRLRDRVPTRGVAPAARREHGGHDQ
jgi:hypothetical protein